MEYRSLGPTGIHVSRLCLGTMTFGEPIGEADCGRLVRYALDQGINFFDTANVYEGYRRTFGSAGGLAEELLGKALGEDRQRAVICTKFANPVGLGPLEAGLSARHLEAELDKSLRRLRSDWIDIVLAHRYDSSVPIEELWRVFDRWTRSGKVLCVGVSNWPAWRIAQACEIAKRHDWPPLSVSSPKYNLLDRQIETEEMWCALHYNSALLTYQPFEGGMLTGKYRANQAPPPESRAAERPGWLGSIPENLVNRLESLQTMAHQLGLSLPGYVVSWLMARPGVTSVIVGCRNSDQLRDVIRGSEQALPSEHSETIDVLFPPPQTSGTRQVLRWEGDSWKLTSDGMRRRAC